MKTFDDLEFNNREDIQGIQAIMKFDNGHKISVVGGKYVYGDGEHTFEIWRSVDNDIKGYLTREEVTEEMIELQKVPPGTPINKYGYGGEGI